MKLANRTRILIVLLLAAGAMSGPSGATKTAVSAIAKPRVLYFTQSAKFKHSVLPESEKVMQALGENHGFELNISQDIAALAPERLKNLDVVIFYTTGELLFTEEQKEAFLKFIKSGKAFIGIHSATDTFYHWAEYGQMIGGYFDDHPWHQEVGIKVEDRTHPATRHLPQSFRLHDEIYQFKDFSRQHVKVLMSLDTSTVDMTKRNVRAKEFPLAWWRPYGQGKVFYTALGHRPEVWHDAKFQTMIVNAIRWAAGELK
jgi:type 1 glutamine amidotransferase